MFVMKLRVDTLFHTTVGTSEQEGVKQSLEQPRTSWESIPSTFLLCVTFKIVVKLLKIPSQPRAGGVVVSLIIAQPVCCTNDIEIQLACS